ncbi:MAG: response regulator [Spirochaeta sp.]
MANILVIEDNHSLRVLLRELLESRSHTVTAVDNGADGIACAKETSFDAVITDIVLPYKSGIEIITELRRRFKSRIKIIAISGGNQQYVQAHLETAAISGANAVLPKPFTNSQLLTTVQKVLSAQDGKAASTQSTRSKS